MLSIIYSVSPVSDINVTINDIANCTIIPVVDKAKYLGSILDREPGHEADVDARKYPRAARLRN